MMMICCPRFVTMRCAFSVCWPYQSMTSTSSIMDLFSFGVPSTLWTGTGFGKGQVSSLCLWTKVQLMNIPVVLELRRADMEMDHREVVVWSSMAMLRAWADFVTPVIHRLCTSASDPMWVQPHHMVTYRQTGHGGPRSGMDHQQDGMGFPVDVLFDFQHMYISRRGDTVRSPSLEINYSPCPLSPSLVSSFTRPWQSEHQ